MNRFFSILCCCLFAYTANAGRSYTLAATRGDLIITNNSTTPALEPGDTLFITGRYTSVQYRHLKGDSANKINIIWLPGSEVKAPNGFQQLASYNVSYVVIEGMRHFNFFGTHRFSFGVHDVVFSHCQWINPAGAYKDQPPIVWDDQNSAVSMVFKGKKSQTFYNIVYTGCLFDGFKDVSAIVMSTNWNSGTTETARSLALDFEFVSDTFQNMNISYGGSYAVIIGTGFGCKVRNCVFKNLLGASNKIPSHSSSILWYGTIDVNGCLQQNSYTQLLRCVPLGWNGLPGYLDKNSACRAWNNIIYNNIGYSPFEFSQTLRGERTERYGIHPVKAFCVFNTIYKTHRSNGSGEYYGFIADNANQDSLDCSYNLIVAPEIDFPFDVNRGYIVANTLSKPKYLVTNGNKVFKAWNRSIMTDTTTYQPGEAALLSGAVAKYSFVTTDFNGKQISASGRVHAGAVEGKTVSVKSPQKQ